MKLNIEFILNLSNFPRKYLCYNFCMSSRIWDPEDKYKDAVIKEYSHWVVEVSFRQHTLGCFIIFAKRRIEKISELTNQELVKLRDVMSEIENVLKIAPEFNPDRFNYLQMGNALRHLHFHLIPRYETQRNFDGKEWNDETFGHPPVWSKTEVSRDLVIKIKETIQKYLK